MCLAEDEKSEEIDCPRRPHMDKYIVWHVMKNNHWLNKHLNLISDFRKIYIFYKTSNLY